VCAAAVRAPDVDRRQPAPGEPVRHRLTEPRPGPDHDRRPHRASDAPPRPRPARSGKAQDGGVKLTLDLHDVYNRGGEIDRALRAVIDEAVAKRAPLVEIIPGKGSGALKKRVLRFLDQKEIKALYHRVEKDSHNHGRIFVHFRWK
jgi:DNA-nicking Smr family endonuclease